MRNALLGVPVGDIDIATDALPETVMTLAREAGLNPVPTGIEHGTITVVSGGLPHEVTTFRADIETDGRHAQVAFGQSIEADASRRDFTMNALYAAPDGAVIDPLGGLPDLRAHRVRFIGDADQRIREDYLRILRFFRFHACYGDPEGVSTRTASPPAPPRATGSPRSRASGSGPRCASFWVPPILPRRLPRCRRRGCSRRSCRGLMPRALAPLIHVEQQTDTAPDPSAASPRLAARMWPPGCASRGPRTGGSPPA